MESEADDEEQHQLLVDLVCSELDKNIGFSEVGLAEAIISLAHLSHGSLDFAHMMKSHLEAADIMPNGFLDGLFTIIVVDFPTQMLHMQRLKLPIFSVKEKFIQAVQNHRVIFVVSEKGSGKSTQLPQFLAESGYFSHGLIASAHSQSADLTSMANQVAREMGSQLGTKVGVATTGNDMYMGSADIEIEYLTEFLLLKHLSIDKDIRKFSVIILNDAHERRAYTYILLGLLKQTLMRIPSLYLVVVTSATPDISSLVGYFPSCYMLEVPMASFPVQVCYLKCPVTDHFEAAILQTMHIHLMQPPGDVVVFLTSDEETRSACYILTERLESGFFEPMWISVPKILILPLLTTEIDLRIADAAPPNTRKVVVATSSAESSMVIDNISYIVDCGLIKERIYSPSNYFDLLVSKPISQAAASKRARLAGHSRPGVCFRLYTEHAFKSEMMPTTEPEIRRTSLCFVMLQMMAIGINISEPFDFIHPPPAEVLQSAVNQLHGLGAIDDAGVLTRLGRKMCRFPLEPAFSKMLLASVTLGCSHEILIIISMLHASNVFARPRRQQAHADAVRSNFHHPQGDLLTLFIAFVEAYKNKFSSSWCSKNYLNLGQLNKARELRHRLHQIMHRYKMEVIAAGEDIQQVTKAIAAGFCFHAASKDEHGDGYRTILENKVVYLHPSSALFRLQPDFVVYHEIIVKTKDYMLEVTEISPEWLVELAPALYAMKMRP